MALSEMERLMVQATLLNGVAAANPGKTADYLVAQSGELLEKLVAYEPKQPEPVADPTPETPATPATPETPTE
jgi:hypothetical protein